MAARALRPSSLLRFEGDDFDALVKLHPALLVHVARKIADPVRDVRTPASRLALVPGHPGLRLAPLADELIGALDPAGRSALVTLRRAERDCANPELGQLGRGEPGWSTVDLWLDQLSDKSPVLLLVGDDEPSTWTRAAIDRADHVVVVVEQGRPVDSGWLRRVLPFSRDSERRLRGPDGGDNSGFERRSVLRLHRPGAPRTAGSERWRQAVAADQVFQLRRGDPSDLARLGRLLSGRAIGLVLGGGGARGFAHIGVWRALREAGLPIDAVGGTSSGAILAAQLAQDLDHEGMLEINERCIALKAFSEYTAPLISLLASRRIERAAKLIGAGDRLEDLWRPAFTVATDITAGRRVVMDRGPVWEAIRASGAIPGLILPVVRGTHLLVDGGLMDNLPVEIMRRRLGRDATVIAVSVEAGRPVEMRASRFPSQRALALKFARRRWDPDLPSIGDILSRSVALGVGSRGSEGASRPDLLIEPDVSAFGTLSFSRIRPLAEVGYRAARRTLERWDGSLAPEALGRLGGDG